jgi:hypothetical protein
VDHRAAAHCEKGVTQPGRVLHFLYRASGHFEHRLVKCLRPGLSVEDATDIMWTIQSPATVAALVMARGWSLDRYRGWVLDQLGHAILAKGG